MRMLTLLLSLGLLSGAAGGSAAAAWQDANAAGDCTTVLAALPSPRSVLERLAAGDCLARTGAPARALPLLTDPDGPDAAFVPWVRAVRARALLALDRPADAARTLDGVSLAGNDGILLRGEALVRAGRGLEAREALRGLLDGPDAAAARAWLAEGASRRGDATAAVAAWQAVWTRHPTSPWSSRAETALAALGAAVPDYTTDAGRTLVRARADTLLAQRQAGLALPLLSELHARVPFTSAPDARRMARASADARQHAAALTWHAKAGSAEHSPAEAFAEALATARSGDYATAAARYRALAARWPDSPQADEAAWKLPWMDYDAGRFDAAEAGMAAYLAARPSGRFASDARWFRAWSAWRRGDRAAALPRLEAVRSAEAGSERATAAAYWIAQARQDRDALRALVATDTLYGYLAAEQLSVRFPTQAEVAAPAVPEAFLASRPDLRTGVALANAGFAAWARPSLARHVEAARAAGESTAVAMAHVLIRAEDFKGAQALARPYCARSRAAAAACLPRPHGGAVAHMAARSGLPPLLPYAIMTVESGLDPGVTSPVGARGLMQLMPELGERLAVDDVAGFTIDDLYRAGVSARLGTKELGRMYAERRDGPVRPVLPLVVAGYNGGPPAVARWLAGYPTPPEADRFAEDIAYTETRRYVRRVLGVYMQYRRTYGDP
jgi:soluble lytic murein transglycosylase